MTTHAAVAVVGASATFVAMVEYMCRTSKPVRFWATFMAFGCLLLLAIMPCFDDEKTAHKAPEPTLEARPDIDHTEKLLLAHYRRIRTEREIANAWTP
jgi:hypothetical protein